MAVGGKGVGSTIPSAGFWALAKPIWGVVAATNSGKHGPRAREVGTPGVGSASQLCMGHGGILLGAEVCPARSLRLPYRALSGQLGPLGRSLIPET